MSKHKYIALFLGMFVIAILAGGGWSWYEYTQNKDQSAKRAASSDPQTLGSASGSNSIPLNSLEQPKSESGGLRVDQNSNSAKLGQLNTDKSDQGSGSSSGNKTSPFDPKTFSQYDKYKDSKEGLFGEVQAGTGAEVTARSKVAVFYRGWLTNGTLFDQSRPDDKGELQPFVFTMGANQVIPGWEQALMGMKVGGVRLLIVPPAVGYGPKGQGPIPGNSVLIFQVQLAAVE